MRTPTTATYNVAATVVAHLETDARLRAEAEAALRAVSKAREALERRTEEKQGARLARFREVSDREDDE